MTETEALIRELDQMHGIIRQTFSETMWRWVLSPAMVDLLRNEAGSISAAAADLPDDATVFGILVRVDEHATHPMLELHRD